MIGKVSQHVGEVTDGGRIDHADPQFTGLTAAGSLCPVGEIAGQGDDLAGMCEYGLSSWPQGSAPTVAIEQGNPDASFEFAQPLRQRGRRHADKGSGLRPRWFGRHGDEILKLPDGEVGRAIDTCAE